jgi:hypothetical protein
MVALTPSFAGDFELCAGLNRSLLQFAPSDVQHQIIVPERDVALFSKLAGSRTEVLAEPQFLPSSFVRAPLVNMTINLRRPFPPVRGWILQQVLKLAATAQSGADVVLLVDSDIEFVRPFSAEQFVRDGIVRFYRKPDEVDEHLPRHVLWHQAARRLLGLPATQPPMPDYVSSLVSWDPAIVRSMLQHVRDTTGRPWTDAIAAALHFSEWTLYGVYLDALCPGTATSYASDSPMCHAWWGTVPLDEKTLPGFVASFGPDDVACMISAKSNTSPEIRRAALSALRTPSPVLPRPRAPEDDRHADRAAPAAPSGG